MERNRSADTLRPVSTSTTFLADSFIFRESKTANPTDAAPSTTNCSSVKKGLHGNNDIFFGGYSYD